MPFPNEHAARVKDPSAFEEKTFRSKEIAPGVRIILGKDKATGKMEVQTYRFDRSKFTSEKAKEWLKSNKVEHSGFEAATNKDGSEILTVLRSDDFNLDGLQKTPEGFLKTDAVVTRVGIFKYRRVDGSIRRELRHPEDVFNIDSLSSLRMIPLVNGHPPEKRVTSETAKKYQIGFTGENVRPDDDTVRIPITVTDESAIDEIENKGKRQLSCGYDVDLIKQDGEYNGERYDCIQTNIRYNHLALVNKARAGEVASIKLDGEDAICNDESQEYINSNERKSIMPKLNLDGIDYDASQEVINSHKKLTSRIDELETENKTLKSAGEKARGDADTLRSENETLNKRNIDSEIKAGVDARLAMERTAATCLDGVDIKGKSDLEIKGLIIAKKFPEMKLDGKSNDYVDACFSNAVALITAENAKKGISSQRQKSSPKTAVKTDVDDTTEFTVDNADQDVARARMIKRMTSVPVSSEN
jgi:hypothetical protein